MTDSIPTVDDLDEAWFTEMLRSDGVLDGGTSVASVSLAPFGSAESMMSALHRATLAYDGPTDAPTSLIVKLASASERQRFVAGLFKFYEREIRYYDELAAESGVRSPRCHLAAMHATEPDFVLVLQEVVGCRAIDQIEGVGLDDAIIVLQTLADLHAAFWDRDFGSLAETFMPMNAPTMHGIIPAVFKEDWANARDRVAAMVPPEVLALGDRHESVASQMLEEMTGPNTLVHADCRSDNLLFDDDGIIVLDFQLAAICHGMCDVSYFISQSVSAHVTAGHVDELIAAYLDRLAGHGIALDLEDAMRPYRASLLFFLSIPVNLLASAELPERSYELSRAMLERASAEILRTGTHLHFA